jgi:formimidoylglutamate deiminase
VPILKPDAVWTAEGSRTGWCVEIDAGRIVGLGPAERYPKVDVPLPGRLLLPGLIDAHSHAFQRAFRGHVHWRGDEQDDFWTWRRAMYAAANRLDPDGIEAVSRLAFLELAEAGVTKVGEFHYLHHAPDGVRYADPDELARRVIAAALDVGIRICLLRVVYGRHSPGKELQPDQRRFGDRGPDEALAAVERLRSHPDPRVSVGLAPHSVRAVPPSWLPALASWRGVTHAHVAEQPAEIAACKAENGRSPLRMFADAGLVGPRFTAVHLTWPDPEDVIALRAAAAAVCVCPSTEMDLGDGFLPLSVREGIRLCVGSDSHAVSDILGEARAIELHARALAGRRNVMTPPNEPHGLAERLLRAATTDGDVALGGEGRGIAVGAPADLVAIDLRRPAAAGVPPLEAAALVASPEWISESWVAGAPVIVDGRHPRRDAIVSAALPYLS